METVRSFHININVCYIFEGSGLMAMIMAEFEKPADCHCLPTEQLHGLLNG